MTQEEKASQKAQLCVCGHRRSQHFGKGNLEDCCATSEGFQFCSCKRFREGKFKSEEEIEMAKEKSKKKEGAKPKGEGRKPRLAEFVDAPFKIYASSGGKEFEAQVLKSGVIVFEDKEYTSPSSAGQSVLRKTSDAKNPQIDGWKFWKFNKDGARVELNALRGKDSPLKAQESAPKKSKAAKAAKPKATKKPRKARSPKANGAAATAHAASAEASSERPDDTPETDPTNAPF